MIFMTVIIRDRDTLAQVRVSLEQACPELSRRVAGYLREKMGR